MELLGIWMIFSAVTEAHTMCMSKLTQIMKKKHKNFMTTIRDFETTVCYEHAGMN